MSVQVSLKINDADQQTTAHTFKPCVGFRLRPSLGSAFKPIGGPCRRTPHTEDELSQDDDDGDGVDSTTAADQ